MTDTEIADVVVSVIADAFSLDEAYIAKHPDLNFRIDLAATSMQYFFLLTELEEKLDVGMESHDFQSKAYTVADAVSYVTKLVRAY